MNTTTASLLFAAVTLLTHTTARAAVPEADSLALSRALHAVGAFEASCDGLTIRYREAGPAGVETQIRGGRVTVKRPAATSGGVFQGRLKDTQCRALSRWLVEAALWRHAGTPSVDSVHVTLEFGVDGRTVTIEPHAERAKQPEVVRQTLARITSISRSAMAQSAPSSAVR